MEILEVLLGSGELCGCFIELLAAVIDATAGVSAYRNVKKRTAGDQTNWRLTWLLIVGGAYLTALVIYKWTASPRR